MKNFFFLSIITVILWSSCAGPKSFPVRQTATVAQPTIINSILKDLPTPKEPLVAAVYSFRDQTGQYKPSETGASWSTAVTQGATSMLMRAMEESGWFVVVERENVNNLLNERKIIRSSKLQYQGEQQKPNGQVLPPLLFAGLLLEGGIISYDANVQTGGAGARYFGTGGSTQFRQDRVTVCLRAIATTSGKVVKTVYTSKTILSQKVDAGVFRFVSFQRLLEAETGYTYNEPADLALTEAIEKALEALVIEGLEENLWQGTDSIKVQQAIRKYHHEKAQMEPSPIISNDTKIQPSFRMGLTGVQYRGDYPIGNIKVGYFGAFQYPIGNSMAMELEAGWQQFDAQPYYSSHAIHSNLNVIWYLPIKQKWKPFLMANSGFLLTENLSGELLKKPMFTGTLGIGGGAFVPFTEKIGLDMRFHASYALSDKMDYVVEGKYPDSFFKGQIGLVYQFK